MSSIYHGQNTRMMIYASYKINYFNEKYLDLILVVKHRVALTELGNCSHGITIGRGRYVRPRVKPEQCRCVVCNAVLTRVNGGYFLRKCPLLTHNLHR